MSNARRGFTLIELLVVVLIIGILASIAIPQYFKVVEKARVAEAMSLVASVKSAQERYLARGGSYSDDFTQLDVSYPGMTKTLLPAKFFDVSMAPSVDANGPNYAITITRHIRSATVATRYGPYALNCNVPNAPVVTCAAVGTKCDELLN